MYADPRHIRGHELKRARVIKLQGLKKDKTNAQV